MQAVEESVALPVEICANVVALQGKPNGSGERLVTLIGCLDAVFMAGWWDDAVEGNSGLQSALLRRIYEEGCRAQWTTISFPVCRLG